MEPFRLAPKDHGAQLKVLWALARDVRPLILLLPRIRVVVGIGIVVVGRGFGVGIGGSALQSFQGFQGRWQRLVVNINELAQGIPVYFTRIVLPTSYQQKSCTAETAGSPRGAMWE